MASQDDGDVAAYRRLIADVYELAGASRASSEALAAETGQTAARWHVLSVLSEQPATVADAARRLGLARQSVQRVVDGLAADELVRRDPNPAHRRAPLIALTPRGRTVCAQLFERSTDARRGLLRRAGVTTEDLDAARATIGRLVAALSTDDAEGQQQGPAR